MKKRISRRQFISNERRHLRGPWAIATQPAHGAPIARHFHDRTRVPAPGCAGSMATPPPLRRASPGARRGRAANNAKPRTSPCAARTRNCSRCRAGRWRTGPTVRSSGPRMRSPPGEAPANGPFEVVARPSAAKSAGQREREGNRRRDRSRHRQVRVPLVRAAARTSSTPSRAADAKRCATANSCCCGRIARASADDAQVRQENFESALEKVTVEQRGPVRAVVRLEGKHSNGKRGWLPFTLRLYFYAGSDALRVLHTIVFDGDESQDFIRGIGLRFSAPLTDALHDRHVRFVGEQDGLFAEAVRGLTGLRRDPGKAARAEAQIARHRRARHRARGRTSCCSTFRRSATGRCCSPTRTLSPSASAPPTAMRGSIAARVAARAASGTSAARRAASRSASAISGRAIPRSSTSATRRRIWPPSRCGCGRRTHIPMDLRFYHDGLGQDTYEKQLKGGLEITYEDYEPGFGTPMGVARTSELMLWILPATPTRERIADLADALRQPAVMVPTPQHLVRLGRLRPFVLAAVADAAGTRAARTAARLDVRLLSRPAGSARLVRILELRRCHAHLRLRSPRVALRHRRLRLGQLRARHRSVAMAVLPAHRPRRYVPLRRSHDAPHRRSRRASPRAIRAAGLAPQRHALGLLGQTTAHQHGVESPLLLLPHRRRTRRRSHARADRGGAHAAHRARHAQTTGRRRRATSTIRTAISRTWVSAPTGVRSPAPGSPSGNARATRTCATASSRA